MNDMHTDTPPSVALLPASNMVNAVLSTCADCFEEWATVGAAWQSEFSQFAERRIKDNVATGLALLSARDPASAWQAQGAWGVRAVEDYAEEANRLARLITSVTVCGATPEAQQTTQLLG